MKNLKYKIFVTLLGIFTSFVFFEGSLRLLGYVENLGRQKDSKIKPDAYRITCLGNSYTHGAGAPPGESYPDHLQRILDLRNPQKYQVINRGRGNINTSYILQNLPGWLEIDKPQIVFAMVGEPNSWNRYGYWDYLNKMQKLPEDDSFNLDKLFRWSRLYRLVELFKNRSESWNMNFESGRSLVFRNMQKVTDKDKLTLGYIWIGALEEGGIFDIWDLPNDHQEEAIEAIKVVFEKDKNLVAARMLAVLFLRKKEVPIALSYLEQEVSLNKNFNYPVWKIARYIKSIKPFWQTQRLDKIFEHLNQKTTPQEIEEIISFYSEQDILRKYHKNDIRYFEKMITYKPTDVQSLIAIASLMGERYPEKVIQLARNAITLNPLSSSSYFINKLHFHIFSKRKDLRKEFFDFLSSLPISFNGIDLKEIMDRENHIENWIISDLEEMIRLATNAGAKVVIQTYPPVREGNFTRFADTILKRWWKNKKDKTNITFQDVDQNLDKFFKNGQVKEEFYARMYGPHDNHLNSSGYREIARLMEPLIPKL